VRNFSRLDLPPDELLARLDELSEGDDRSEGTAEFADATVGTTCLYAIYDPVERRCTMARAGHPPPALVHPDGTVELVELPAGSPLGLGGFPFATAEMEVAEGSKLVLYTDGLVEDRDRDIDESLEILGSTLSRVNGEPEETCGVVLEALLPRRFTDDIRTFGGKGPRTAEPLSAVGAPSNPGRGPCIPRLAEQGVEVAPNHPAPRPHPRPSRSAVR
jgi:hypothetical protein